MIDMVSELYKHDIDKISQKNTNLNILILGAYRPENMMDRLKAIRDCLRQKGFSNTYIVADFSDDNNRFHEDNDIHWTQKSNDLMSKCDLIIFIFLANCDNSGPTDEFSYFCYEVGEFFRCIILCENEDGCTSSVSSRIRAKIKDFDLRNIAVKEGNDADTCEITVGLINLVLMKEKKRIYKNYHL